MKKIITAVFAAAIAMSAAASVSASAAESSVKGNDVLRSVSDDENFVFPEIIAAKCQGHFRAEASVRGNGKLKGVLTSITEDTQAKIQMDANGNYASVSFDAICGEKAIFTATADDGWKFVQWTDAKTGKVYSKDAKVTVTQTAEIIAVFEKAKAAAPKPQPAAETKSGPEKAPAAEQEIKIEEKHSPLLIDIILRRIKEAIG